MLSLGTPSWVTLASKCAGPVVVRTCCVDTQLYEARSLSLPLSTQSLLHVCLLGFDLGFDFLLFDFLGLTKDSPDLASWKDKT